MLFAKSSSWRQQTAKTIDVLISCQPKDFQGNVSRDQGRNSIVSKVLSTCPFCGCGCGILLDINEETILASLPLRTHPVSRGTLCIKGWQGHHFVHSDKRLLNPLVKQNDHFITASWDQAVKTAADGLARIRKESGPDAIGFIGSVKCTNEENFLLGKLARAVIGTNNIDTVARLFHGPTIASLGANA